MSTLAERFIAAVDAAVELDATAHHPDGLPAAIWTAIMHADAPDDGLRAATYEARVSVGHLGESHPERMVGARQPGAPSRWRDEDLRATLRAGDRFWQSVDEIHGMLDQGTADTWPEALHDVHLICQAHDGELIRATIDLAHDMSPFHRLIDTVEALRTLAMRWGVAHVATIQERLLHPDVCLSHARLGQERPVSGRLAVCKTCRDLIVECFGATDKHSLPQHWPPAEMLDALEGGRRAEYRRLRAEWLETEGIAR